MDLTAVPRRFGDLDAPSQSMIWKTARSVTYDHRIMKSALPVRSAVLKQDTGALVLGWVTTGEYALLYVFVKKTVFFLEPPTRVFRPQIAQVSPYRLATNHRTRYTATTGSKMR